MRIEKIGPFHALGDAAWLSDRLLNSGRLEGRTRRFHNLNDNINQQAQVKQFPKETSTPFRDSRPPSGQSAHCRRSIPAGSADQFPPLVVLDSPHSLNHASPPRTLLQSVNVWGKMVAREPTIPGQTVKLLGGRIVYTVSGPESRKPRLVAATAARKAVAVGRAVLHC